MKVSERLKVVDVIGTKVYKDGEQIIAQVQFISTFSSSFPIGNNYHVIYTQYILLNYVFLCQMREKQRMLHVRGVIILFQKLIFHLCYSEKHPSLELIKESTFFVYLEIQTI